MQVNLNLEQIKRIIGVEDINSDDSFFIRNISSLENAKEDDIAFLFDRGSESVFDPISLEKVKNSKAGFIVSQNEVLPGKKYLIVPNTLDSLEKIIKFCEEQNLDKDNLIHSNSIVSKKAVISDNVSIGAFSVVGDNTSVGESTIIGSNVFIDKNVIIGKRVTIYSGVKVFYGSVIGNDSILHSNAIIGSDGFGYSATKEGLKKIPQIGIVKIGSKVEVGANTTIDKATFDATIIGDGCKIDNLVHIAHNVIIGSHTVVLAQTGIAGGVEIGMGCQIGGQVAIKDHVKIGNSVKIVSKSGIMKDLDDNEIVAGIPAMPFGQWKRSLIIFSKLPKFFKKFTLSEKKLGFWARLFK